MAITDPLTYFSSPASTSQKHYEALRAFFVDNKSAPEVAQAFGYTVSALYSLTRDFRQRLQTGCDPFFAPSVPGRKAKTPDEALTTLIVHLRKQYLSVPDIQAILATQGHSLSTRAIDRILKQEGFARLPRRSQREKSRLPVGTTLPAPESVSLTYATGETFSSESSLGLLCFLPYIRRYGIDRVI